MKETLLSALVFVSILVLSAVITNWFARAMYLRCTHCGTLNAKRRVVCRNCQSQLRE